MDIKFWLKLIIIPFFVVFLFVASACNGDGFIACLFVTCNEEPDTDTTLTGTDNTTDDSRYIKLLLDPSVVASVFCVKDTETNLIWEVKADDGGLRDKDNTYTWYNAEATNGGSAVGENWGECLGSNCDTQSYVVAVNAQGLCGYNNWRLPTDQELYGIVIPMTNPEYGDLMTIDYFYFPNTMVSNYWTSIYAGVDEYNREGARTVHFNRSGSSIRDSYRIDRDLPVRLVHDVEVGSNEVVSNEYETKYIRLDNSGNELNLPWSCVKDTETNLIWEVKTNDGGLRDTDNSYSWYNTDEATNGGGAGTENGGSCVGSNCDTQSYVAAVNAQGLCGYNDWRMPTEQELLGIVKEGNNPAIDVGNFPNTSLNFYWTASTHVDPTYVSPTAYAWIVNFYGSGVSVYHLKIDSARIRLVR